MPSKRRPSRRKRAKQAQRQPAPAPAAPVAAPQAAPTAAPTRQPPPVARRQQDRPQGAPATRFSVRDYTYIKREVRNILVLAVALLVALIVISFFLP